ncbi:hypothetical protein E3P96_02462 [Wallemia ichthyophaga]|nr:hypothetical protein E3P96_02462 [Wallemia ichthyophaga]
MGRPSAQLVVLVILLATSVLASYGDRQPAFRLCVRKCLTAPPTRTLLWTTTDLCRYKCMHEQVDVQPRHLVAQYYGKWPFYAVFGIQEPLSTLFSLLNLLAHRRGLALVRRRVAQPSHRVYALLAYVQMGAWVASSVFHTRDVAFTERLDYLAAGAAVFAGLNVALVRVCHVSFFASTVCLGLVYALHSLSTLSSKRIDYGWHLTVVIAAGMLHNLLWLGWCLREYMRRRKHVKSQCLSHRAPYTPVALVALTMVALSLELLEFVPIGRSLDAHALWHAATAPLAVWWWSWLVTDAEWLLKTSPSDGRVRERVLEHIQLQA